MKNILRNTPPPPGTQPSESGTFSTVRDDDLLLGLALFGSLSLERGGGGQNPAVSHQKRTGPANNEPPRPV